MKRIVKVGIGLAAVVVGSAAAYLLWPSGDLPPDEVVRDVSQAFDEHVDDVRVLAILSPT